MYKTINKLNITLSIVLFLTAIAFFLCAQNSNLENNNKTEKNNSDIISKVCFENKCFKVEIADTTEERETGLMNRKYLEPDSGMLFLFKEEGEYNFWMKNVLIPLDMIWINESNRIVFIKNNAEPCRTKLCEFFNPNKKAKYVLEVNGGISKEVGIEIGDVVEFRRK